MPSAAGAGGYGGGVGGTGSLSPSNGNGPGGGVPDASSKKGQNGTFTGDQYLVPLVGGSGGSGAASNDCGTNVSAGGGGGGGAILIASSTTIDLSNGTIRATGGGSPDWGGGGSGGAIRLVSNAIYMPYGQVLAGGGSGGEGSRQSGHIRLEAFSIPYVSSDVSVQTAQPLGLALPATPPPTLRVTNVNKVAITENPFSFPDTTIDTGSPVEIAIQGNYVPVGTTPTLYIYSETGPDLTIAVPALTGTLQNSTATVSVTLPTGGSRGFVKATWSQ